MSGRFSWPRAAAPATTADLIGAHAPLALCTVPIVAALVLAYEDGGYFITSWGIAALILLGLAAAAVLVFRGGVPTTTGLVAVAGWGGLAAWQGVSALWADEPASSTAAMGQTLLYGAAFTLVLVASRGAGTLRKLLGFSLIGCTAVSLTALGARLLPDLFAEEVQGRLSVPISYWNSLGLVFAFGFVLAAGLAGDASRARPVRALAAATIPVFPLGILFAQSRGALLVMVVGSLVLLLAGRGRVESAAILAMASVVCLPLLQYANSQSALSANRVVDQPHAAEGARVLVALVLAATLCAAGSLGIDALSRVLDAGARRRRLAGLAIAGTALVLVGAAVAVRPPSTGPVTWADQQFEAFKKFDPRARDSATTVADRLVVAAGSGRWQNWTVAAEEFRDAPVTGTGAGDYRFRWAAERPVDISVRNAHSLYLETLAESGLIGLILLLTPAVAVLVSAGAALRRHPPLPLARDLGVTIAVGATVGLHLAGDWAWQTPAVVLPAVALGAAAIAASAPDRDTPSRGVRVSSWIVAALATISLLVLAGPVAAASRLDDGRRQAADGDLRGALRTARGALDLSPQSAEARQLEANVLADLQRPEESDTAFARAMSASPREWSVPADWASALLRRGDVPAARPLIRRALALNPREPRLALLRQEAGL